MSKNDNRKGRQYSKDAPSSTACDDVNNNILEKAILGPYLFEPSGKRVPTSRVLQQSDVIALYLVTAEQLKEKKVTAHREVDDITKKLQEFQAAAYEANESFPIICDCIDDNRSGFVAEFSKMPPSWFAVPSSTSLRKPKTMASLTGGNTTECKLLILQTDSGNIASLTGVDEINSFLSKKEGCRRKCIQRVRNLICSWENEDGFSFLEFVELGKMRVTHDALSSRPFSWFGRRGSQM